MTASHYIYWVYFHIYQFFVNLPDINECSTLNGGCNQICRNNVGSYQCLCKAGYRLSVTNQKSCQDINECNERRPCDLRNGICQNLLGTFRCSCQQGYLLLPDKKTCRGKLYTYNKVYKLVTE